MDILKKIDSVLNDLLDDIAVERSVAVRAKDFTGAEILSIVSASVRATIEIINIYKRSRGL